MKDEELKKHIVEIRSVIISSDDGYRNPSLVVALDQVLDPDFGMIAAKQAGWAIAHERANAMQELATENELLKLRVAELEENLVALAREWRGTPDGYGGSGGIHESCATELERVLRARSDK